MKRRSAPLPFIGVVMAGSLAYFFLPTGLVQSLGYDVVGATAAAAIVAGVRRWRPSRALPWYLLALGQVAFVAGDLIWTIYDHVLHRPVPYPSVADVLYLSGYPFWAVGLALFIRGRRPGVGTVLDAAVVTIGLGMLVWVITVDPVEATSFSSGDLVSMAYPLGDILLLAAAVPLLLSAGLRTASFVMLMVTLGAILVSDVVYAVVAMTGTYTTPHPVDIGWLLSYAAIGAAALHPSMRGLTAEATPASMGPLSRRRVALLAFAGAVPAGLISLQTFGIREVDLEVAVGSAVLMVLLIARIVVLIRQARGAVEHLEAADRVKNEFLTAVSHELRTPLTSVLGFAGTLLRYGERLSADERRRLVTRLGANAHRLEHLLVDLLDLDRLTRGVVEARRTTTDVAALARRVVDVSDLPPGHPVEVVGDGVKAEIDPAKVERILENLVLNASRHTPPGTPVVVRVARNGEGVLLSVDDEGPGVPAPLHAEIFEPFKRGIAAEAQVPGVGIGLSLVAQFAGLHGGRAWVEDRAGGGASFRVLLPDAGPAGNGASARATARSS